MRIAGPVEALLYQYNYIRTREVVMRHSLHPSPGRVKIAWKGLINLIGCPWGEKEAG